MATLFGDLVAQISGEIPGYSPFLAQRHLQSAWRDILNRRTWSFLIQDGGFNAPVAISAGTVAITQNSLSVIADVTAGAALNAVVSATPPLTQYQFRVNSSGGVYNILAWDNSTRTLTLDRPILETTAASSSYLAYQCYFPPPPQALVSTGVYDFNRWISVVDPVNGYVIRDDRGKAWLDLKDPQRSTFDLAYQRFDYKVRSGVPYYEFWPHPSGGQQYIALYKAAGQAFASGATALPAVIPDALVVDRAIAHYAYRWAAFNAGRNAQLGKTNWLAMKRDADAKWEQDLQVAKLEDDNVIDQMIIGPMAARGFPPIDAAWLQSHSTGLEPFV